MGCSTCKPASCPCKCCVDKGYELVLQMDELDDNDDFRLDVEEALAAKADDASPSPLSSLAMLLAFAALTCSNTAWTTFQVYFHEAFGLDFWSSGGVILCGIFLSVKAQFFN